jgi:prepilin-type processing-associated H-X9-DG protein
MTQYPIDKPENRSGGFSRIDLVASVAIVLLAGLLAVPLLASPGQRVLQAECAANLRQFAMALHVYAGANSDRLPASLNPTGPWPTDLSIYLVPPLLQAGMKPENFFCPVTRPASYRSLVDSGSFGSQSVFMGYAASFAGIRDAASALLTPTNQNVFLIPQRIEVGGLSLPPPSVSSRVLLADTVLTTTSNRLDVGESRFYRSDTDGVFPFLLSSPPTAHTAGAQPAGGNLAMMDGHVEWRPFEEMEPRTRGPYFFWW